MRERTVRMRVNGREYERPVDARLLLADFLRDQLGLTGTHLGCEHGVCGACTIIVNGAAIRSCLMLAIQANAADIVTVEGLADGERLHPLQEAFSEQHALQCGFCTPGFLMTLYAFLRDNAAPTDEQIREAISGNLCRCTGYVNIERAVKSAAARLAGEAAASG
jgi:aerobic-type carbon monoxide dehydrogenase small subunit (CoxS/CutS family)